MPREKGKSRVVSDSSSSSSSSSEGQQVVPGRRRRPDHRIPSFKEREPARSSRGDRHERETSGYLGDRHERHEPRSSNMERVSYKKDSESQTLVLRSASQASKESTTSNGPSSALVKCDASRTQYAVLGISTSVDAQGVRAAYKEQASTLRRREKDADEKQSRKLIRLEHRNLKAAYAVLKDPVLRAKYDAHLRKQGAPIPEESESSPDSTSDTDTSSSFESGRDRHARVVNKPPPRPSSAQTGPSAYYSARSMPQSDPMRTAEKSGHTPDYTAADMDMVRKLHSAMGFTNGEEPRTAGQARLRPGTGHQYNTPQAPHQCLFPGMCTLHDPSDSGQGMPASPGPQRLAAMAGGPLGPIPFRSPTTGVGQLVPFQSRSRPSQRASPPDVGTPAPTSFSFGDVGQGLLGGLFGQSLFQPGQSRPDVTINVNIGQVIIGKPAPGGGSTSRFGTARGQD